GRVTAWQTPGRTSGEMNNKRVSISRAGNQCSAGTAKPTRATMFASPPPNPWVACPRKLLREALARANGPFPLHLLADTRLAVVVFAANGAPHLQPVVG